MYLSTGRLRYIKGSSWYNKLVLNKTTRKLIKMRPSTALSTPELMNYILHKPKAQGRALADIIQKINTETAALSEKEKASTIVYTADMGNVAATTRSALKKLREDGLVKKLSTGTYMVNPNYFMAYDSEENTGFTQEECYDKMRLLYEHA